MSAQRLLQTLDESFDLVVRVEDMQRQAERALSIVRPTHCAHVDAMRAC
jgi:hypothetical protein